MLTGELAGGIDLVLSDMAISATGHRGTDQVRNRRLAELAFDVARRVLKPGRRFVVKAFHGGGDASFVAGLKRAFREVRSVKPTASRPESAELYLVARGFRGGRRAEALVDIPRGCTHCPCRCRRRWPA